MLQLLGTHVIFAAYVGFDTVDRSGQYVGCAAWRACWCFAARAGAILATFFRESCFFRDLFRGDFLFRRRFLLSKPLFRGLFRGDFLFRRRFLFRDLFLGDLLFRHSFLPGRLFFVTFFSSLPAFCGQRPSFSTLLFSCSLSVFYLLSSFWSLACSWQPSSGKLSQACAFYSQSFLRAFSTPPVREKRGIIHCYGRHGRVNNAIFSGVGFEHE